MRPILLLALGASVVPFAANADISIENLECPCSMAAFDMYEDGGTLGGELRDANGNMLQFCLDGRMGIIDTDNFDETSAPDRLSRQFFVGASHPSHPGAIPLDVGGDAEKQLLDIFDSWVEHVLPMSENRAIIGHYNTTSTAQASKAVIRTNKLSKEQASALWVNRVVSNKRARLSDELEG